MGKNIKENWAEIEAVEQALRERYQTTDAGFNPSFFFGEERALLLRPQYRKNGKYIDILIKAKFCPFSGKKLFEDE